MAFFVTFDYAGSGNITITYPDTSTELGGGGGDPTWQTITDGATVTLAWLDNSINAVTLGGNRTLAISGTPAQGESCIRRVKQDGTGGRTLTWPTSGKTFNWPYGEEAVLTTTTDAVDVLQLRCVDATVGALVFDVDIPSLNLQ